MGQPVYFLSLPNANCEIIVHNKTLVATIKLFLHSML
jgi:hypothetical protein